MSASGGFIAAFGRCAVLVIVTALPSLVFSTARAQTPDDLHTYYTGGVHNDKDCLPPSKCVYARKPGEPTNPLYPRWWASAWTMYRVFKDYDEYPPPYANPPQGLTPDDYQVSYGATYYDSTYLPADRDGIGAMRFGRGDRILVGRKACYGVAPRTGLKGET